MLRCYTQLKEGLQESSELERKGVESDRLKCFAGVKRN